jgi:hypothetical protein
MAIGHQRSVGSILASAACALALFGCEAPTEPARVGRLELRLEPEPSYTLIGRFHVNAIEPWSPSRDIDFDSTTSHARIDLPPGIFSLELAAGARLVCAGEDPASFAPSSAAARLVSALPRVLTIAPGELTTARISFGAAPTSRGEAPLEAEGEEPTAARHSAGASDPCGARVAIAEPVADWQ